MSIYAAVLLTITPISLSAANAMKTDLPIDPPPPVRDVDGYVFYVDKAYSVVDPALKAKDAEAAKPLHDFCNQLARITDAYRETRDEEYAKRAVTWLDAWASGGALLGKMKTPQAYFHRQLTLCPLAVAWLTVRPFANDAQRRRIDPWLKSLAGAVLDRFEKDNHKRNNHFYWAAFGYGAVAVATGDDEMFEKSRAMYLESVKMIGDDGSLPLEMKRGKRAFAYHNYAVLPLVLCAELGAHKGENWYAAESGRLHLLAKKVIAGFGDPSPFQEATGLAQDTVAEDSRERGWLFFYDARFPTPALDSWIAAHQNMRYAALGGKVSSVAAEWTKTPLPDADVPSAVGSE